MVTGFIIQVTARCGFPMKATSGPIIQMGDGFIPTMDGPGLLITNGDGLHFIMEDGNIISAMGGCGFREMNGHRPGWLGVVVEATMDGLL